MSLRQALLGAGALATVLTAAIAPVAHAQQQAPRTIEDTEINDILHRECDPVFVAAGLNPREMRIILIEDKE
ncbi:hypothetical protein ABTN11_20215, partial [Acinetobacter baumannii]